MSSSIYLAARYSRHPEMRGVRDVLTAIGHTVTSRWIDMHGGKYPTSFTPEILNDDPAYCGELGQHDVEDVTRADTCISFTSGGGGKGGRHVEFGLALGLGKRVIVVGPREHIFHTLPQVEHFHDWPHLVMALAPSTDACTSCGDSGDIAVTSAHSRACWGCLDSADAVTR